MKRQKTVIVEWLEPAPGSSRYRVLRVTRTDVVVFVPYDYQRPSGPGFERTITRDCKWRVDGPIMVRLSPRSRLARVK